MRIGLIAFAAGSVVSFLAGMLTNGLAACYAVISLWVWGVLARLGGESLANERVLNSLVTATLHGLAFAVMIVVVRFAFPRIRENEIGSNLFLVAVIAYGVLLTLAFPVKP